MTDDKAQLDFIVDRLAKIEAQMTTVSHIRFVVAFSSCAVTIFSGLILAAIL